MQNVKNYNDLIDNNVIIPQYIIENNEVRELPAGPALSVTKDSAINPNVARSMMAQAILSQVKYHYNSVEDYSWNDNKVKKYVIMRRRNEIVVDETYDNYQFLAFYNKKDRDNFLKYNREEIEYYFMIKDFYI